MDKYNQLSEQLKNSMIEMAERGVHQWFLIQYGAFFGEKNEDWWLFIIDLDEDYYISVYKLAYVDVCEKDDVCFSTITGSFRLVKRGSNHVPAEWFLSCITDENKHGRCLPE